jgi:PilZ domain-containing protein
MSERRNTERKRVVLEARWESMSRRHQARVDDVSLGGCFVNTYGPVELNEAVSLQILLPAGVWLNLRGTVVTYQPGVGFGISFTSLTAEENATLQELIKSAIERDL